MTLDDLATMIRNRMDDLSVLATERIAFGEGESDLAVRVRELQWVLDQITSYEGLSTDPLDQPIITNPTPYNIWVWWSNKVGVLPAGKLPGKEAAAAKRLTDMGLTLGDLDIMWDWMKTDPWYAAKGIDLPLMASAVLKWRAVEAVRKTVPQAWDGHV